MTTTLGCSPSLVQQVWQRLHIDINEDPNELIELKAIVKQYRSLVQSTDRISAKVDGLPDNEKDRLHIEGGQLIQKIKDLRSELHELLEHRQSVIDRNPSFGGQDARADRLAEFVAVIFEETGRSVTFGHFEGEPTTDFGRKVREVLDICDNKRLEVTEMTDKHYSTKTYITNWRQPAHKAAKKRKR
ncbi:hypothetical protein OAD74_01355 [Alphaproteobacteria bacterium]|nr:hypothetical protein [Alphaproteobacteria bacterium]